MNLPPSGNDGARARYLAGTHDMEPVQGTVDVDIPIDIFWECFRRANYWPRWNKCFFWGHNRDLKIGKHLIWAFQPIKPQYLYKMWSIANIVEVEDRKKVTWEVTALPGMYARHTYHVEDLGNGRTRFGSWEQGTGGGFNLIKKFWIIHFTFVKDESLKGAAMLEQHYKATGQLDPAKLPKKSYLLFWIVTIAILLLLAGGIGGAWFYSSFVKLTATQLAPGVNVVTGGGGNSLVVEDGGDALLVDTKFSPGSKSLHHWIDTNVTSPVTKVVNTHYHYDHTQGNSLYPSARKIAHASVPALMRRWDNDWWAGHDSGVPTQLIPDSGADLQVGSKKLSLVHPPPAHTAGDLWVFLPADNIVATGDLVFNSYYPFMDQPEGGTSIPGMILAIRKLTTDYPNARFVPGHGPVASAQNLSRYGDYLQSLYASVIKENAGEEQAAADVNLRPWKLAILPSLHHNTMIWATANNNVRWAYRLAHAAGERTL